MKRIYEIEIEIDGLFVLHWANDKMQFISDLLCKLAIGKQGLLAFLRKEIKKKTIKLQIKLCNI